MSVTPDGRRAVSGSNDQTLQVWIEIEITRKRIAIHIVYAPNMEKIRQMNETTNNTLNSPYEMQRATIGNLRR